MTIHQPVIGRANPARLEPMTRTVRRSVHLATVCLLACACGVPGICAAHSRARAAEAYAHALRLRAQLERHPSRSAAEYEEVARAFRAVYRADPAYTEAPAALASEAELYQAMGRRFASDRYYSKAIATDQFLAAQYPGTRLGIEAMYHAAEICRKDLENPIAARTIYQQFLKIYPNSRQAPGARAGLAAVNRKVERWNAEAASKSSRETSTPRVPVSVQTEAIPDVEPNPAPLGSPHDPPAGGLEDVESIQHWTGPNYTRVVIRLGGKVTFKATQLEHPPRLVFDFADSRPTPELARKVLAVQDGFLERIRVAQFQPTVTRVVLDVPRIENYSVFSLPDPFRLVIDIHGDHKQPVETAAMPASDSSRNVRLGSPRAQAEEPLREQPDGALAVPHPLATGAAPNPAPPRPSAGASNTGSFADTVAAPAAGLDGASPTLTRALGLKIRRIVIDAGHGGHDTGTIGPTGLEEKNVVLDVALRLRSLIERRMGCQVIMTRSTDTFIPLEERTAIANEYGADLFVSIHANSSPDPSARGIEIYYLNFTSDPEALAIAARENATSRESVYQLQSLIKKIALSEKIDESREFAKVVDTRLVGYMDDYASEQPNRGVKKAPFVVLIGANMPSILAEISFLSNPTDERLLRKGAYREKIAVGLYRGILRYANSLGTLRVAER